jgi:hypothetical protein
MLLALAFLVEWSPHKSNAHQLSHCVAFQANIPNSPTMISMASAITAASINAVTLGTALTPAVINAVLSMVSKAWIFPARAHYNNIVVGTWLTQMMMEILPVAFKTPHCHRKLPT